MSSRGALPTLDESVFFKLVRVVNLTARPFVESIGKAHRLSLNEWRVLLVLAAHAGASASEVVERCGLDKMSVSRAVATLVRRGRVLRQPDAADGRRWQLRLSAEGERLYRRIGEPALERERLLFRGIAADERAALARTLDRMIDNLREPAEPAS